MSTSVSSFQIFFSKLIYVNGNLRSMIICNNGIFKVKIVLLGSGLVYYNWSGMVISNSNLKEMIFFFFLLIIWLCVTLLVFWYIKLSIITTVNPGGQGLRAQVGRDTETKMYFPSRFTPSSAVFFACFWYWFNKYFLSFFNFITVVLEKTIFRVSLLRLCVLYVALWGMPCTG